MTAKPQPVTPDHLQQLFTKTLARDAPQLSWPAIEALAAGINHVVPPPPKAMREKVEPVLVERGRRLMAVWDAGEVYRAAVADLLEFVSLAELKRVFPPIVAADQTLERARVSPAIPHEPNLGGAPRAKWHEVGWRIAGLLVAALSGAGHRKRLSPQQRESLTAILGAAVVSHVFRLDPPLEPRGFAQAMEPRRSLETQFPILRKRRKRNIRTTRGRLCGKPSPD